MLAALASGLGTCWIHLFDPEKLHQLLRLPDTVAVVTLLALGYPAENPPPRPRLPLESIIWSLGVDEKLVEKRSLTLCGMWQARYLGSLRSWREPG